METNCFPYKFNEDCIIVSTDNDIKLSTFTLSLYQNNHFILNFHYS